MHSLSLAHLLLLLDSTYATLDDLLSAEARDVLLHRRSATPCRLRARDYMNAEDARIKEIPFKCAENVDHAISTASTICPPKATLDAAMTVQSHPADHALMIRDAIDST